MGMKDIIRSALFTPGPHGWGLPILFWGPPGVGKSAITESVPEEFTGFPVEVLSPGERGEGAFGVVPVPVDQDGQVLLDYPMPRWTSQFGRDGAGLVFVDELTTAAPSLQPPLLGLVHARRIAGGVLGKRVRVIGAANPPEQAAAGYDLPAPLANRFVHLTWDAPTAAEWSDFQMSGGGESKPGSLRDPAQEEARIMAGWAGARARAVGEVTAFISRRPDLIHKLPSASDAASVSRAWPSHRTWDLAIRALAGARLNNLSEVDSDRLLAGCIGDGAMTEFAAFRAKVQIPDIEALADGRENWTHDPKRLDVTLVVLQSLAALVAPAQAPKRQERKERVWEVLIGVMDAGGQDLAMSASTTLMQSGLGAAGKGAEKAMQKLEGLLDKISGRGAESKGKKGGK